MPRGKGYPGLSRRMGRRQKPNRRNVGVSDDRQRGQTFPHRPPDPGPVIALEFTGRSDPSHHVVPAPVVVRPSLIREPEREFARLPEHDPTYRPRRRTMAQIQAKWWFEEHQK